jgi:SAM-dependent methyltransferase
MQPLPGKSQKSHCPVCDSVATEGLIEIPDVPVFCNLLLPNHTKALDADKGEIHLLFCHTCGHLYNGEFDPNRMQYHPGYENPLHYSPTFQSYLVELAQRLVSLYDLYGKDIIEIGCGQGEFLRLLAEMGPNRCTGFDPSADPQRIEQGARSNRLIVIQDYFSERYADYRADFIACRQVLEHIAGPRQLLKSIQRALDGRDNPVLFVEVPNAMFTLQQFGIWDLIYEHCSYFTTLSLSRLLVEAGFKSLKITETFGGQYLCSEAQVSADKNLFTPEPAALTMEELKKQVQVFADKYRKTISAWQEILARLQQSGPKPVIWGAGSKGVTFLNVLKINDAIDYVIDLNPSKQGMYIPGTGQRIVPPEWLPEIQPQAVIVMNPLYMTEIQKMITVRKFDKNGKFSLIPAS